MSQGFLLEKSKLAKLTSAVELHYAPSDEIQFNNLCKTVNTTNYLSRNRKATVHGCLLLIHLEAEDSQQVNTPSRPVYGTKPYRFKGKDV